MISIIIPVYNEEEVLEKTLLHFKSLTLPHEIIVTDDKSTDLTITIAQKYADVVLSTETKHPTIGVNRNVGARVAHGDILVFMDSTSIIFENLDSFFTRALKHFADNPKLVALTGALWVEPDLETFTDKVVYTIFNWTHIIKNNWLHTGEAPGKFQMIRREAFEKIGGYRADLVSREDAEIFMRLSKIGLTLCDPSLKVYHSGRRAHAIGWPKLLSIWMTETFWLAFFGKTRSKNWVRWWEKDQKI